MMHYLKEIYGYILNDWQYLIKKSYEWADILGQWLLYVYLNKILWAKLTIGLLFLTYGLIFILNLWDIIPNFYHKTCIDYNNKLIHDCKELANSFQQAADEIAKDTSGAMENNYPVYDNIIKNKEALTTDINKYTQIIEVHKNIIEQHVKHATKIQPFVQTIHHYGWLGIIFIPLITVVSYAAYIVATN